MIKKIKIYFSFFIISNISAFCYYDIINYNNEELLELQKEYREGPTCNLNGIYLSLLPKGECVDLDAISQRERYQYTVNFMWINKNYSEHQYILPSMYNGKKAEYYLDNIINWAFEANHDTLIQIWYDSKTTSEEGINRTKEYFLLRSVSRDGMAPIVFRDLRSLPIVKEKPMILDEKLLMFLKIDLMKVIIVYSDIVLEGASYSAFADIDVNPMSNEDLYDTQTMKNLQEYGFVMGDDGQAIDGKIMENQFQILGYYNKDLLEAWGYVIITRNLVNILNEFGAYEYYNNNFSEKKKRKAIFNGPYQAQMVFYSYGLMFDYFKHLSGMDTLMVDQEPYSREKHGLEALQSGIVNLDSMLPNPQTKQGKEIQEKYEKNDNGRKRIPVKDIHTIVGQSWTFGL